MRFAVSEDMNESLIVNFFDTEIKIAVFQMKGLGAPGQMVYLPTFFKKIGPLWGGMFVIM